MVIRRWSVVFLWMLCSAGLLLGQKDKPDHGAIVDEALKLSGIENTLSQVIPLAQNQVGEYEGVYEAQPMPEGFAALRPLVKESFQVSALYASVKGHVAKNADPERLSAVLKGLRSPLVQKMISLDAQASSLEALRRKTLYGIEASKKPPAPERKALIERLDKAAGATELAVEIPIAVLQGMTKATDPMLPPGYRLKKNLPEIIRLMRTRHRAETENNARISLLYTYRSVSDKELKQYVEFLESGPVKWFNGLVSQGVLGAIGAASDSVAQGLAKGLPARTDK